MHTFQLEIFFKTTTTEGLKYFFTLHNYYYDFGMPVIKRRRISRTRQLFFSVLRVYIQSQSWFEKIYEMSKKKIIIMKCKKIIQTFCCRSFGKYFQLKCVQFNIKWKSGTIPIPNFFRDFLDFRLKFIYICRQRQDILIEKLTSRTYR